MRRRAARWPLVMLGGFGLLLATWFGVFAPEALAGNHAAPRQPSALVLHPAFHDTGLVAGTVWASGRYTFVTPFSSPAPTNGLLGTLIDGQTGRRTVLSRPGCGISPGAGLVGARPAAPFGGPWLLFNCASASVPHGYLALYGLASGQWQVVAVSPSVEAFHDACADGQCGAPAIAVGTAWVEFDETCYHCADTYVFQNLQTGQVASDPTNATTTVDLNTPTLATKVCRPLRVQRGSLTFYGSFAITNLDPVYFDSRVYLERCGTHLQKLIDPNIDLLAASAHVVLWRSSPTQLAGLFLPSLRRLTLRIPARVGNLEQLVLSSRSLEIVNSYGHLWTTPIPVLPRPQPSRR